MPLISERLKKARKARHLTQANLAKQLHVTQQRIAKWENGFTNLTVETLVQLTQVLDCTTDWLLGLVDDQHAHLSEDALSADERRLIELHRKGALPIEVQRLITQNPGAQTEKHLAINSKHQPPVIGEDETADSYPI